MATENTSGQPPFFRKVFWGRRIRDYRDEGIRCIGITADSEACRQAGGSSLLLTICRGKAFCQDLEQEFLLVPGKEDGFFPHLLVQGEKGLHLPVIRRFHKFIRKGGQEGDLCGIHVVKPRVGSPVLLWLFRVFPLYSIMGTSRREALDHHLQGLKLCLHIRRQDREKLVRRDPGAAPAFSAV